MTFYNHMSKFFLSSRQKSLIGSHVTQNKSPYPVLKTRGVPAWLPPSLTSLRPGPPSVTAPHTILLAALIHPSTHLPPSTYLSWRLPCLESLPSDILLVSASTSHKSALKCYFHRKAAPTCSVHNSSALSLLVLFLGFIFLLRKCPT